MKFCIFCGEKPQSKTKEHVIPKWLIEITGDPNRLTFFGRYKNNQKKFAWKNFTFPACNSCNEEFSAVEATAKVAVSKILGKKSINGIEINNLLDWLDKIRVGLWLGQLFLEKIDDFERNFHIKQRVATSDRLVAISYIDDNELGISYTGTGFPTFRTSPSCFTLTINNIVLFNFSKEFCFSKRLGLPAPGKRLAMPGDNRILVELEAGNERVMLPIIRQPFYVNSIKLYQSIINPAEGEIEADLKTKYYNDLISDRKSNIFVENDFSKESKFLNDSLSLDFIEEYSRVDIFNRIALQTLRFQNYCIEELSPSTERLSKEEQYERRKHNREIILYNKKYINDLIAKIKRQNSKF